MPDFFKVFFFIEVYLIYNVVLVSGVQPSEIYICMHIYVCIYIYDIYRCQVLFHQTLLGDIEYSSLYYRVGLCRSSIFIQSVHVCMCVLSPHSCPALCDPMTAPHQAPLSMGFSRQEYWSEFPCPPPGALPDPGI